MFPISTLGQGQAMLMAQATPSAETNEQIARQAEDASQAEKGKSRYVAGRSVMACSAEY